MFQYPGIGTSTGEPPTTTESRSLPTTTSTTGMTNQVATTTMVRHHHPATSDGSNPRSSLTAQEPDSGYEASPSSIAGSTNFSFESSTNVDPVDPDLDFENITDSMLLDGVESNEWDNCCCCESPSSCLCYYRTDSSTTTTLPCAQDDNCDTTECSDMSSSNTQISVERPSSLPISIPICIPRSVTPASDYPSPRLAASRHQQTFAHVAFRLNHPLSWPFSALMRLGSHSAEVVPRFLRNLSPGQETLLRASRQRQAVLDVRRRRSLDSDADVSSSDSDGPEDVFNLSEEMPHISPDLSSPPAIGGSLPVAIRVQPLPDIVQSSSGGRRGRSISVNLPPEPELLRSIGRSLIRISDQFQRERREFCNGYAYNRRRTASDIYQLKRS